jgi:hypothetical protein
MIGKAVTHGDIPRRVTRIGETMTGSSLLTASYWRQVAERAVKTFGQVWGAALLAGPATSLLAIDWSGATGLAAVAAVASVATSLASSGSTGEPGSPSLVKVRPTPPTPGRQW